MNNSVRVLHSWNKAGDCAQDRLDAALTECGLSVDILAVLHSLMEAKGPLAPGELGGLQSVKSNAIQLISFLIGEGLVQPVSDEANSGMARMAITAVGRQRYRLGQALSELAWDPG